MKPDRDWMPDWIRAKIPHWTHLIRTNAENDAQGCNELVRILYEVLECEAKRATDLAGLMLQGEHHVRRELLRTKDALRKKCIGFHIRPPRWECEICGSQWLEREKHATDCVAKL